MYNRTIAIPMLILLLACNERPKTDPALTLFVGTYTDGGSEGIYRMEFNTATGALSPPVLAAALPNPSYLALSGDGEHLYAVQETDDFDSLGGGVTAFGNRGGTLEALGSWGTGGAHPCQLSLSGEGHLAVANYSGGNVALFSVGEDGTLLGDPQILDHKVLADGRTAHAHMARFRGEELFVADLGLDALRRYRLKDGRFEAGPQASLGFAQGAGPRHFEFGADGKFLYVINELNSSISVFGRDDQGGYGEIQTVGTLDPSYSGENACADLHLSPDGKFLYGSNRGENSLVIFAVDGRSGTLSLVGRESTRGNWPRNFTLDPDGRHLLVANRRSGNIVVFQRDPQSGTLVHLGSATLPDPVCLLFSPSSPR